MIPVKLKLSNFTSYGQDAPELDFSSFHMAAISGQNGAGKSSLLDAITWCVWGTSRAGDTSDALIRLGQNDMAVEFIFELDGNIYTVKRRRSRKSGGNTSLELWSNSHNLTEGTIKTTQQKIIDTLHLSFETFTNSSFLRQGHADEFTTKGPTDRKRILADILGLDHYGKLEEKAKDKAKEYQTKLTLLEYQMLEIETELSFKDEREKMYSQLQLDVIKAKTELKEIEQLIKKVEEEKQSAQVAFNSLLEQKKRFEDLSNELQDLKVQIELKEKAKNEYQLILDKKELIESSYKKLQELKGEKQALELKRSELIKVKDELVEIEKTISEREDKRKKAISDLEIQSKEYQTKNEQLAIQNKLLKEDKSVCPTCGQKIAEEKNKSIVLANEKIISENEKVLSDLGLKIDKFKSIELPEYKLAQQKELVIKKLEEETKSYPEIQLKIDELIRFENGYLKLQQAEVAVKTHQETLEDLKKMYVSRETELKKAKTFEEDLAKYEEKLKELEEHLEVQITVKNERSQTLLELTGKVGEAKQLIDRATQFQNLFKQKREEQLKLSSDKEIFEELSLAFGKKGIQAMIIESAIPEIEDETNRLLDKLTEGRMKVTLETQKETKTKVQTAEGKIHATVETLDIIISDEMGERPYELYSGGETFRVNFALRLAISKLLANRAGAKLQFLVIDEGFGTQDAPGRARLVEVLDTIKNDFEKIVVITHIEELKDEFPARIEVSKNSGGSSFEVVGV